MCFVLLNINLFTVSELSVSSVVLCSETVNKLMFSKTKHFKDPDLKKIGQTQNEMMEVLKKQADVLYQAFQSQSTPTRQATGTSSAPKTSTPSSSGSKPQQKQDKKPWKPWNKNKKFDKNKSNTKPTTTVNEVEDQPEEDEAAESEAEEQSDGGDVESQE